MHNVQHARDVPFDVVLLFAECSREKFTNGLLQIILSDHLLRDADRRSSLEMNFSALRLQRSGDEFEDRTFAGTVLAHNREFRIFPHRKLRTIEDGFLVITKLHVLKPKNDIAVVDMSGEKRSA